MIKKKHNDCNSFVSTALWYVLANKPTKTENTNKIYIYLHYFKANHGQNANAFLRDCENPR